MTNIHSRVLFRPSYSSTLKMSTCYPTTRRHLPEHYSYSHFHEKLSPYVVFACSNYSLHFFPSTLNFLIFLNRLYRFLNTEECGSYAVVAHTSYLCSSVPQGVPVISMTSYLDSDWKGTLSNASLICHFDTINLQLHDLQLISTKDKDIMEPTPFQNFLRMCDQHCSVKFSATVSFKDAQSLHAVSRHVINPRLI